jgi:hypothetical protein
VTLADRTALAIVAYIQSRSDVIVYLLGNVWAQSSTANRSARIDILDAWLSANRCATYPAYARANV